MTQDEKLTPEYIVEVAATLTPEELIEIIRDYGNQCADDAEYWANKNSGY